MTRFVHLSPAAAFMLVLAGCGAEPRQEADVAPVQDESAAVAPAPVEAPPAAEKTAAEAPAV
jgi:uncharacterized lipoprotein